MVFISTIEEYRLCQKRGYEPLFHEAFTLDFGFRQEIQKSLFFGTIPEKNIRYYRWNWNNKPHHCEECARPLHDYSAYCISHIITKGSHPEIAHDPRNNNILCPKHHDQWENSITRKSMIIYDRNLKIIELLKKEYYGTKRDSANNAASAK